MAKQEIMIICENVFKSGENMIRSQFTQKWIDLINQIERTKGQIADKRFAPPLK